MITLSHALIVAALAATTARDGRAPMLSLDQFVLVADAAEPVCRRSFAADDTLAAIEAYARREGYTDEMKLALLTYCASYGHGYVDGLARAGALR